MKIQALEQLVKHSIIGRVISELAKQQDSLICCYLQDNGRFLDVTIKHGMVRFTLQNGIKDFINNYSRSVEPYIKDILIDLEYLKPAVKA